MITSPLVETAQLMARAEAPNPYFLPAELRAAFDGAVATWLGRGAFGETWHLQNGREAGFAAKIVLNDRALRRVDKEIQGLQRCRSEFVVRLFGAEQRKIAGRTHWVLRFEFVDGGDVLRRIEREEFPSAADLPALAVGLLTGVRDMHACDVVHRDLKPGNIGLRGESWRRPVILDLGLAKLLDQKSITIYPNQLGTPPFMAPEQLRGERASKMSDMWAIGVVLACLARRQHPYWPDGGFGAWEDALEAALMLQAPLPAPCPESIRALVARLMSPEPYQRGSAARALKDLES